MKGRVKNVDFWRPDEKPIKYQEILCIYCCLHEWT